MFTLARISRVSRRLLVSKERTKSFSGCSGLRIMSSSSTALILRSLKWHRYALLRTGSSGSSPRNMYMRVFSIMAKSSGLSSDHFMSHASLRSKFTCPSGAPLPLEAEVFFGDMVLAASMSKKVRTPLMSMMDMRVELQLMANSCGRHRSTNLFSKEMWGSVYLCTMPDSRPTSRTLSEAATQAMASEVILSGLRNLSTPPITPEEGTSSMWNTRSLPSFLRSMPEESAEVSLETEVLYCHTYTTSSEAATIW
mmetsp:Transcript_9052/g.14852  ORF Transcript_9052/g.14852 Transcript_9052/m.14852 type:complete len:253 (-) Transcript_9052:1430-2188(-)